MVPHLWAGTATSPTPATVCATGSRPPAPACATCPVPRRPRDPPARARTPRPTPSQPAKPVTTTGLHKILTNPYYQGTVTFRGVTYDGTHEPLVDAETWLRVQTNLDANNARGERPQKYDHYLKGTLYCSCGPSS
ncbi:recombinase family protein [Flaviflexus massiliensis]|uniref:recombinase family protein n=1 Tax=Flaviflexus massiliensis TaxID=1522309 RepID=UPI0009E94375|nr:recombinase family protein [Flaviflexus massiliensis]